MAPNYQSSGGCYRRATSHSKVGSMLAKAEVIIDVQNLVYTYPGSERPAVNDVSFQVFKGEVFGLLGPSGAGKSTIQKVLTRQHRRITSGSVSVLGKPLGDWDQSFYERIGVGFELPNHYLRMTARENLDFFASLYKKTGDNIADLLALVGLEKAIDVRVSEFSKGMMMRLNFVRALLHDPELIFLDEPTSGLDPVNAQIVKEIVRNLQRNGKTIVLTTHNMSDVEALCERVGFMVKSEMKSLDSKSSLKAKYGKRIVTVEYGSELEPGSRAFPLDGLAENKDFLALLARESIRTIHSQEASLDQVFAHVTGSSLVADAGLSSGN